MAQIEELRKWRHDAIESHLYSTAELVGDKILAMSCHPDDAYWLAQTYYGMGEYLRGAELITRNAFETESLRCRYVAGLCLLQAQELDRALALLTAAPGASLALHSAGTDTSGSQIMTSAPTPLAGATPVSGVTPLSRSRNPSFNLQPLPVQANFFGSFGSYGGLNGAEAAAGAGAGAGAGVGSGKSASASAGSHRPRVISSSSIKTAGARGGAGGGGGGAAPRTLSGSSRVSLILPDLEEDSASLFAPDERDDGAELNGVFVEALIQFLLGRVYTLQSKFGAAKEAYIAALRIDARCFDALAQLTKYHALSPKEEWALLASLDFSRVGTDFGHSLYALRLSVLAHDEAIEAASTNLVETYQLPASNGDILAARGDSALARGQYARAAACYAQLLAADPHNLRVCTNHVTALYELGETNTLYRLAHELAAAAPDAVETWYATGVYYLATRRIPEARRHFSRASLIDPGYAAAWLAFGRTFAEEAEHEKAITAFSTVTRLFPGFHVPYVHIGIQHLQLMNLGLAEKYLITAAEFFDEDPLLLNELGVVYYHKHDLPKALQILEVCLAVNARQDGDLTTQISARSNLGYVLCRLGRHADALEAFEEVCRHAPLDANVLAAVGLCLLQLGRHEDAAEKLALALAIARDDPVAKDLMTRAVEQASDSFDVAEFAHRHDKYVRRERAEISFA